MPVVVNFFRKCPLLHNFSRDPYCIYNFYISGTTAIIVTAEDIPGENKIGHLKHDQYTLIPIGGITHYLGDAIALVAARDKETADKAAKLNQVEYKVLPHIHTIEEAAKPDAPKVFDEEENNICAYKHISRGNAAEAIKNSKYVISHHKKTQHIPVPEMRVPSMVSQNDGKYHGSKGKGCRGYRCIRISWRSGSGARMYPCSRSLSLRKL